MAKKLQFEDGIFEVPNRVKCSCCGREVLGEPNLVRERVYKFFGGSWERYLAEYKCQNCKREEREGISNKLNEARLQERIEKAKRLLEDAGYIVEKK